MSSEMAQETASLATRRRGVFRSCAVLHKGDFSGEKVHVCLRESATEARVESATDVRLLWP